MAVAVYLCDSEGRITFFNAAAADLWGRSPELGDGRDRYCGSHRLWSRDGRLLPHDQTPMAETVRTGMRTRDHEVVIEQPDGHRVPVLVNTEPLRDGVGRIVGAINAFTESHRS